MKAITKEEYISRKNKLETKSLTWFGSEKYKKLKAKHLKKVIRRAIRFITYKINHVDSFEEPREFDFDFDWFTYRPYAYTPDDFIDLLNAIQERFNYLDVFMKLYGGEDVCWIEVKVSLKKEEK